MVQETGNLDALGIFCPTLLTRQADERGRQIGHSTRDSIFSRKVFHDKMCCWVQQLLLIHMVLL